MDINEILELAARAACASWHFNEPNCPAGWRLNGEEWNPIHDSGQEADMEAMLGLTNQWGHESVLTFYSNGQYEISAREYYADYPGDLNEQKKAARRMAGTRAAAEIGRRMGK